MSPHVVTTWGPLAFSPRACTLPGVTSLGSLRGGHLVAVPSRGSLRLAPLAVVLSRASPRGSPLAGVPWEKTRRGNPLALVPSRWSSGGRSLSGCPLLRSLRMDCLAGVPSREVPLRGSLYASTLPEVRLLGTVPVEGGPCGVQLAEVSMWVDPLLADPLRADYFR